MLRSIFNCTPLLCTLMLASVTLTACGGGSGASGSPDTGDQSTLSGTIDRNVEDKDVATVEDTSTNSGSTIEEPVKQNSSLSASRSSVRNLTETTKSTPTQAVAKSVASSSAKATTSNAIVKANSSVKTATVSSVPLSTKSSVSANSKISSSIVATSSSSIKATSSIKASSSVKASSSIKASSSSKTSSAASSKAASSISIAGILGADIEWTPPTARENGTYLTLDEIGGYQIRFRALDSDEYTYIQLPGNSHRKYKFPKSIVGLQFEIAVYDNQGLYSDFVPITSK